MYQVSFELMKVLDIGPFPIAGLIVSDDRKIGQEQAPYFKMPEALMRKLA